LIYRNFVGFLLPIALEPAQPLLVGWQSYAGQKVGNYLKRITVLSQAEVKRFIFAGEQAEEQLFGGGEVGQARINESRVALQHLFALSFINLSCNGSYSIQ